MPAELGQLQALASGQLANLYMGNLPLAVAKKIECHPGTVYLGAAVYKHIVEKHGEIIDNEAIQLIPLILVYGSFFFDATRPDGIVVFYPDRYTNRMYFLALKRCENGSEVWVSTFYYISHKNAKSKQKRFRLVHQKQTGGFR